MIAVQSAAETAVRPAALHTPQCTVHNSAMSFNALVLHSKFIKIQVFEPRVELTVQRSPGLSFHKRMHFPRLTLRVTGL